MIIPEGKYLAHYGILRRSGRYPWGSGGNQSAKNRALIGYIQDMKSKGLTESEIAEGMGIKTGQLRAELSIAKSEEKAAEVALAVRLREKGMSHQAIGERINRGESYVRSLLAPNANMKADALQTTARMLEEEVKKKGYIDVGSGVENQLGIAVTRLSTAVNVLQSKGYVLVNVQTPTAGTDKKTTVKVLCPPGKTSKEHYVTLVKDLGLIKQISDFSDDDGQSYFGTHEPLSVSSKRIDVVYGAKGAERDGVIFVRPNVSDISMGATPYAQVRILVDGSHYLKGMAMYNDKLPDGVDLQVFTPKKSTGLKSDAFKTIENDPDNPFGSSIRQMIVRDPVTGKTKNISAINLVGTQGKEKSGEEGHWETWHKSISSQILSKQKPKLAQQQLGLKQENERAELDRIMELQNPAVKKILLDKFAESADSSAVFMKAAPLPGQASHVILPIPSLKDNEIYAPNYNNGDRLVLIRHPHGGPFEIPELVVNNNNREAKRLLGSSPRDAVAINHRVAEKLSGADFDGDTVIVVPNNNRQIVSKPALEGLKDFNPREAYPKYEGMHVMSEKTKQLQMGDVSNLITDMTIRGASDREIAQAVRHSMVVIDAQKHKLNYKQSALDNNIKSLKEKYQDAKSDKSTARGASTIVSRAKGEVEVPKRRAARVNEGGPVDPKTGRLRYTPTGESYVNKQGVTVVKTQKVRRILEIDSAHELSSGQPIERLYADHADFMKSIANEARLASMRTAPLKYNEKANKIYAPQVKSLNAKLNTALQNRPRERSAQLLVQAKMAAIKDADPTLSKDRLKKLEGQALNTARVRLGAKKQEIEITDDEWSAIQAGAITHNKLTEILKNSPIDRVRELATPQNHVLMTGSKIAQAQTMLDRGYTQKQVADALGVSLTTLKRGIV